MTGRSANDRARYHQSIRLNIASSFSPCTKENRTVINAQLITTLTALTYCLRVNFIPERPGLRFLPGNRLQLPTVDFSAWPYCQPGAILDVFLHLRRAPAVGVDAGPDLDVDQTPAPHCVVQLL